MLSECTEAVAAVDGFAVGAPHQLESAERAHQNQQGAAGKVEVGVDPSLGSGGNPERTFQPHPQCSNIANEWTFR
jgi:hypothetical protein